MQVGYQLLSLRDADSTDRSLVCTVSLLVARRWLRLECDRAREEFFV
jgi:hypothetical protein